MNTSSNYGLSTKSAGRSNLRRINDDPRTPNASTVSGGRVSAPRFPFRRIEKTTSRCL